MSGFLEPRYKVVDKKVHANAGTKYPIKQAEIDVLQDPNRKPIYQGSIGLRQATSLALHALKQPCTDPQKGALLRLKELEKRPPWGDDVAIKTFNDLDLVLFRGILRNNIYLAWAEGSGMSDSVGVTFRPGKIGRRCTILLSINVLQDGRARVRDVWATVIHEMIHAYFMVECGNKSMELSYPQDPCHGPCYLHFMYAIKDKMGGYGRIPLSVTYNAPPQQSYHAHPTPQTIETIWVALLLMNLPLPVITATTATTIVTTTITITVAAVGVHDTDLGLEQQERLENNLRGITRTESDGNGGYTDTGKLKSSFNG